ncbi:AAA family ATPase [Phenylobacterium sp.]|uniref:AAA family ATPase n=1 Tax=Phenylobacterium sp. TaxID=1871053 RepID=UPI0035B2C1ED
MTEPVTLIPGERQERRAPVRLRGLDELAFTADELGLEEPPARAWHVPQLVPAGTVTLLQGDGGTGKSLLALQLAAATTLGKPWLGQEVRRGNALYLSAEDDRDEIHRRLSAVTLEHGVALDSLTGLKVVDLCGEDAVLADAERSGRLQPTPRWHEFAELARAWQPSLITIDNLADVFAGEENSRPQARQFIGQLQGLAREICATVVLIGHPSLAGIASGSGSSGSTAWNNSVRSRLYLTKPAGSEEAPADPDARVLTVKKANYGPSSIEVRLRWAGGVFRADGPGTRAVGAVDRQIAEARAEHTFLALLDAFTQEGRWVGPNTGHTYAPALFARDPRANGVGKPALASAMGRLFASGSIIVQPYGPPSKDKRRIARAPAGEGK